MWWERVDWPISSRSRILHAHSSLSPRAAWRSQSFLENTPLKPEGWSDAQLMVADIAEKIAKAGAPRCCERDSRIAVRVATGWFNKLLGTDLVLPSGNPTCEVSSRNEACLTTGCPYY